MLKRIENPGEPISISQLEKTSSEIGLEFPNSYKKFLLESNGGLPEPDAFPIKLHDEEVGTVQVFFGVNRDIESSCLKWNYEEYRGRIPDSYLPIACSDTNDLICLVLSGEQYGSVIFWDAMDEDFQESLENVYEVADSFTHFLEILFED